MTKPASLRMLKPLVRTPRIPLQTLAQGNSDKRLSGKRLQQRRQRILARQPLCVDCEKAGRVTLAQELDHEVPLWEGGPDTEDNLAPRCIPCHAAKTRREARRRYRGGQVEVFDDLP